MSQLQLIEARAAELNCKVIAVDLKAQIVLCARNDADPKSEHVTWAFDAADDTADFFWGHYIVDPQDARDDYQERVATCLANLSSMPRDAWGEEI